LLGGLRGDEKVDGGDVIFRCATWKVILCVADVESATGGKA